MPRPAGEYSWCPASDGLAGPRHHRSTPVSASTLPPADAPALLTARQCAALLSISPRHWLRLVDAGRAPAPLRLGAAVRWPRRSVEGWVAEGCPAVDRR